MSGAKEKYKGSALNPGFNTYVVHIVEFPRINEGGYVNLRPRKSEVRESPDNVSELAEI